MKQLIATIDLHFRHWHLDIMKVQGALQFKSMQCMWSYNKMSQQYRQIMDN